jgi:hypothetical protein
MRFTTTPLEVELINVQYYNMQDPVNFWVGIEELTEEVATGRLVWTIIGNGVINV